MTPTEDDVEFTGITITITQTGKLGVSRSIAFIIRNTGTVGLYFIIFCVLNDKLIAFLVVNNS